STDDTRSILSDFRIFYLMGLVAVVASICWRSRLCVSKKPTRGPSTSMRRMISTILDSWMDLGAADKKTPPVCIDAHSVVAESTEVALARAVSGKNFCRYSRGKA